MKEPWWDVKAGQLQRPSFGDYPTGDPTRNDFYRVVLHTRQDLILVVSYLSSLNKQFFEIKALLVMIAVLLLLIVVKIGAW